MHRQMFMLNKCTVGALAGVTRPYYHVALRWWPPKLKQGTATALKGGYTQHLGSNTEPQNLDFEPRKCPLFSIPRIAILIGQNLNWVQEVPQAY